MKSAERRFRTSAQAAVPAWLLLAAFCLLLSIAGTAAAILPYIPPITEADVAARKEQAAAGDKGAQSDVATWYFSGSHGLPLDRAEAAAWYRKAAEQEDDFSQRALAAMYEFGEGIPVDHDAAVYWIRRALVHYRGSATLIAHRYRVGQRAPQDFRKAAQWCRISAEAGDIDAQNMLGELYETGAEIRDYAEAAKWYRLAAEAEPSRTLWGVRAAMFNLGRVFAYGRGVPQDYAEAIKWYNRAIDAGNFSASYGLGLLYEQGHGVAQDFRRAIELYYAAAPIDREARERLFLLYERELPLPKDDAAAIEWYRTAAQNGDARARAGLGLRYKFGKGVERDWGIAFALFHLASRSSADLPDFLTPAAVAERHMSPAMWNLVNEMTKPGNFLNALDAIQRIPADARDRALIRARLRERADTH
jgi:uncharacterized protein